MEVSLIEELLPSFSIRQFATGLETMGGWKFNYQKTFLSLSFVLR